MVEEALTETSWKKRLRNRLVRPMLPWLVGSFGIQASNIKARSFVEDLVSHLSESYLPGREIEILRFQQNSSGSVHVELAASGERFRLELPLYPGAERRIDASVRNVRELAEMEEGSLNELRVETPDCVARLPGAIVPSAARAAGARSERPNVLDRSSCVNPRRRRIPGSPRPGHPTASRFVAGDPSPESPGLRSFVSRGEPPQGPSR